MFLQSEYLYLFFTFIPLVIGFYLFNRKKVVVSGHIPTTSIKIANFIIFMLSLSCIIVGLCQPCYVSYIPTYKNCRLFFLLDSSLSMCAAEDVKPNRLEMAKSEIKQAYSQINGNYQSTLIPFSGIAVTSYCPFTYSKTSFLDALQDIDKNTVDSQGTDIVGALYSLSLMVYDIKDDQNVVFLISDGGLEEGLNVNYEELHKIAAELTQRNFKIYTFGIGGKDTPLIKRIDGKKVGQYTDKNNIPYKTSLDEDVLKTVSKLGKGDYTHIVKNGDMNVKIKDIIKNNQELDYDNKVAEQVDISYLFYAMAAVMLFISHLINFKI